ncbi:hypothetical protein K9L67_05850 [Candidatus Woesearchaeota archaeon]|nr:hypothetical protein [Candidatus Woesearchaeota archaeon]MCF7901717.1 hypothetical protein [Candidatus Woesearchaeota archaeon]MCF8013849.1 hypothetical protein [Candidatus Woesearchaeota archaeon]
MRKKLAFLMIILILLVVLTSCMKDPEVCDYDGYCGDNETNNCVDCENVIGRGLDLPPDVQTKTSETGP